MSQIEVPDWVVEVAARVVAKNVGEDYDSLGQFTQETIKATQRECITAALVAWVVPTKFQSRERFMGSDWSLWRTFDYPHDRDSDFDRMNNADGWQAERRDLFTLRQEKPE